MIGAGTRLATHGWTGIANQRNEPMGQEEPVSKNHKDAAMRDEPCGPSSDDSGITNVGGSASGRRQPHGCTHLQKPDNPKQKEKPAR